MTRHVDLVEVARGKKCRAARKAFGKDLQLRVLSKGRGVDGGVTGVRHEVHLVEAVGQEVVLVAESLLEHTKKLGAEHLFWDAVEVVEARKRAPAQIHRREHVRLRPVDDSAELVPVVDVLELHLLDRRAGDDEAVVVVVLERVEGVVELDQVVSAHVRRLMAAHAHEVAAHLQRRLRDQAQDLRLGLDLCGHEVQDDHAQRADLLVVRDFFLERKDALLVQGFLGGQAVGNVNGHELISYADAGLSHRKSTAWDRGIEGLG